MSDLVEKTCQVCEGGVDPLSAQDAKNLLEAIPGWDLNETATEIKRVFQFKGFFRTMSFVNAVAWIANKENHHPDMEVSYNKCVIRYTTHAINGLSENDFICAAKVNKL